MESKLKELAGADEKIQTADLEAKNIIESSKKEARNIQKEAELKSKETVFKLKEEAEVEIKEQRSEIQKKEKKLEKKEENLDSKLEKLEDKEKKLNDKNEKLEDRKKDVEKLIEEQSKKLEKISELSKDEAKEILLNSLNEELTHESAITIKGFEKRMEEEKDAISKKILSTAISKGASDYVVESVISVVQLPNDEMKGRIIGREGRNIRTIEQLTGVDVIIDDTPEAVVISSFDSVRREAARLTVEKLVADGRIHPAKIEEALEKSKKEVELSINEGAEQALLELGLHNLHPEIKKKLGRLRYRTSYGQNILTHSIEVGRVAGVLAAELGANVELAKRGGLLHDIGKAMDHDIEGSHAVIGAEFLRKYKEHEIVSNSAGSHHGDEEATSVEAVIVQAADAISASRPGARRETLHTYIKRLETLEKIANDQDGVESAFAIQAGRELRIIVNAENINDDLAIKMSRDVSKQIESEMQYPGQIKVTVIRETRAVEYAK